jgi:RNA-splicing ligase RtcB
MKVFLKFMRSEYNKARSTAPEYVNDVEITEKFFTDMLRRIGMDEGMFYKSLMSVGGGNHFIEIGNCDGKYAFTVHCGSRNFGLKVWKYWDKIASSNQIDNKLLKEAIKDLKSKTSNRRELPEKIAALTEEFKSRTCSNGYLMGENMNGYLTDMVIAQAYAKFNHKLICDKIAEIFKNINGAKVVETIQSIHNYVSFDDKIIRKGAIRAYEDEKMVIPFNMRDGLAICIGKSNEDWNCSAPHGAGRIMSRSKAKANISLEEFKESMKNVYTTSVCKNTIDESPMAYKDTNTILNLIGDTCDIIYMVKPVINIKSTDEDA